MHVYISTACQHDLHGRCRRTCKFCDEACLCLCHSRIQSKETAMTEPLDNPAAPDADSDEPVEFDPATDDDGDQDDEPTDDPEDDEAVTPPADDDGEPEDSAEDDTEAPAEAEADDPPVAVEGD